VLVAATMKAVCARQRVVATRGANEDPHGDSTWPRSQEVIARDFADVPEGERARILGANVARVYGLEVPMAS
jgi:hypothetical protein